jgi:adenosylcobyric acid synthase
MFQGAGSNVGKSLIVAGLCRAFARRGLRVRPFKPQNMSNNAAVAEGGEIGRAQALQARAAMARPLIDMNPVLLKPESEQGAQLVVHGRRRGTLSARQYGTRKAELMQPVLESFARLGRDAELLLVEGAGSPAETNLRAGDIANMGFAEAAQVPVVLIGDIERGGVIAQLVGTHVVLNAADRALVRGFIVNKFRGDHRLFADGSGEIERRTGWPDLGLVPWLDEARRLPAEDSLGLAEGLRASAAAADGGRRIRIAVPRLSRMANFDDLDPLRLERDVDLVLVEPGAAIPGDAAAVLIAGSKSTIADLAYLRAQGWDIDICAHRRRGGVVVGICAGFQMLGRTISDPRGLEGPPGAVAGLAMLDVDTEMAPDKQTREVHAMHIASGCSVTGYEIHLGAIRGPGLARPMSRSAGQDEGAVSADGLVMGTQMHGLFANDAFRRWFLTALGGGEDRGIAYETMVEATLDGLAAHLEQHLDCDRLLEIARQNRMARSA